MSNLTQSNFKIGMPLNGEILSHDNNSPGRGGNFEKVNHFGRNNSTFSDV